MNNKSQSLLSQFSNHQLQQLRRAPTLEEKEQLIIKFKQENVISSGDPAWAGEGYWDWRPGEVGLKNSDCCIFSSADARSLDKERPAGNPRPPL